MEVSVDLVPMGLQPSEPLWQRAPSRDADGRLLSDFMMLIPRLSGAPALRRERIYTELRAVFRSHADEVRFADLNLRLNLVWVSLEASPGLIPKVAGAIRRRSPPRRNRANTASSRLATCRSS